MAPDPQELSPASILRTEGAGTVGIYEYSHFGDLFSDGEFMMLEAFRQNGGTPPREVFLYWACEEDNASSLPTIPKHTAHLHSPTTDSRLQLTTRHYHTIIQCNCTVISRPYLPSQSQVGLGSGYPYNRCHLEELLLTNLENLP